MLNSKAIHLMLAAVLTWTAGVGWATTYYVCDANGDDARFNGLYPTYTGGSNGPKHTIAAAAALTSPADTMRFVSSRDSTIGDLLARFMTSPTLEERLELGRQLADLLFKEIPSPARVD